MKILLILLLLGVVSSVIGQRGFSHQQQGFRRGPHQSSQRRPQQQQIRFRPQTQFRPSSHRRPQARPQSRPQSRPQARPQFGGNSFSGGGAAVDERRGGSEYHFSWKHVPGQTWSYSGANNYCRNLGGGFAGVSINDESESKWINARVSGHKYIWTSGNSGTGGSNNWKWASGRFSPLNWSRTGGAQRSQPDNREKNESCLAVLDNFYRDGIVWHDVACHHKKPIICERSS